MRKFSTIFLLLLSSEFCFAQTDKKPIHLLYSMGISIPLHKMAKNAMLQPPSQIVFTDTASGPADTDKDGIVDSLDKCPDIPGLAKYNGCPVPDADNDGIPDELDKCPNQIGYARYDGCPVPDTDGDGVNDEDDKCPAEAGSPGNGGCPTMQQYHFDAGNVRFSTGSAVLTAGAKKELDKGAGILKEHADLRIAIEGYTDNAGSDTANKKLSQKRADAVKTYLVNKGISAERLTANGFGSDNPIADNNTKEGRDKNRRVEFKTIQ